MFQQKIKTLFLFLILLISVLGALFFPSQDYFQMFFSGISFLVFFPYLAIRFALKEPLKKYGFSLPPFNKFLLFQLLFLFFLALATFLLIFSLTPLKEHYSLPLFLSQDFSSFLIYSLLLHGAFSLMFSSFFQGLLLSILRDYLKEWAILFQWGCFIVFLFLVGDFSWDMSPYIFVSLFSGAVGYISRSVLVSFLFSWSFVTLISILLLKFF